jgi:aldehyde:ferredoxin oxidoreductase
MGVKKKRPFSYGGEILRVNLSNGHISRESTLKYAREWMGASGIAVKILYDELKSWVTPYEPVNELIFGAGSLLGTPAPGACKMNVSTLGPMTGGWATSCSDSYLGGELKYAGYDSIICEGRSPAPVYLWIQDDRVEIRDAAHLWGKTTWETLDILRRDLQDPNLHCISIGPGGENLVRGACIVQDKGRAFGRCGTGAVMGSKNLKAIVAKGTGSIQVADPERFMATTLRVRKMFEKTGLREKFHQYGTLFVLPRKQEVCGINYKNFQECCLPEEMLQAIDPTKTLDKYTVGNQSAPGCVIGCGRHLKITEGPYAGLKTECNQWETFSTLQTRLAVGEPTFMLKANAYCNQLGIDVDAAGGAIGWAMECFQRGILKERDTDGLALHWGDPEVALELIRKIAYREGFGYILAEGCARAADLVGRDSGYYALHIKGQDLYEPCRGSNGWLLGTTTSTRGGTHTTGALVIETAPNLNAEKARQVYGEEGLDRPLEYKGKAKMVTYMEAVSRMANCLGICLYSTTCLDVEQTDLPQMAELYSAATGWETTVEDLKRLAMKQLNLEKAFNLRFTQFDRKDDMPTPRDLAEPIPSGRLAGWKIDREKYNQMLDEYYDLHGWDRETSYPRRKTLVDLGLENVAEDLARIGKLR